MKISHTGLKYLHCEGFQFNYNGIDVIFESVEEEWGIEERQKEMFYNFIPNIKEHINTANSLLDKQYKFDYVFIERAFASEYISCCSLVFEGNEDRKIVRFSDKIHIVEGLEFFAYRN